MTRVGCKWISAHLDEYLSGGCTEEEREAVELHLAVCVDCCDNVRMWSFLKGEVPRAPLPPLSPMVKRRILSGGEVESFQESAPRRIYPKVGAAVVAAVAVLVSAILLSPFFFETSEMSSASPPVPQIEDVAVNERLESIPDTRIQIVPSGKKVVDVTPGTALWLADDAVVVVKALDETQAVFRLVRGLVVAEIGPVPSGFRFVVETPEQEIEARGTVFAVQVEPSGASSVRVAEGTVEVRHQNQGEKTHIVTAGHILPPTAEAPVAAPADDLAADFEFIGAIPHRESLDVESPPDARLPASSSETPQRPFKRARKDATKRTAEHEHGPDRLLELALGFRRSSAYRPAAETYERIISEYPGSSGAAISLVSLGQLRLTALDNPGSALTLFNRYLDVHPRGSLRAAALSGKVRALTRLGRHAEVVDGVAAYLAEYPRSGAAPEMIRHRGDARLVLGQPNDAIRDYTRVIRKWPNSAEAARAQKSLARCGDSP